MDKALFLDLDGTLIATRSGRDFPLHEDDWRFNDSVLACIKHYAKKEYDIYIISNQGGIESGYITVASFERKINKICDKIEKLLNLKEIVVGFIYCANMISYNRKPNPGMAYELAIEHELDLRNSVMVGDMQSDREFAINAGIGKYLSITEVEFNFNTEIDE